MAAGIIHCFYNVQHNLRRFSPANYQLVIIGESTFFALNINAHTHNLAGCALLQKSVVSAVSTLYTVIYGLYFSCIIIMHDEIRHACKFTAHCL